MTDGPLSYYADVPLTGDLVGLLHYLDTVAEPIRRAVPLDRLGVGLRLPAPLAAALAIDRGDRRRLRSELDARDLEVATLDITPASGRAQPERLRYTVDCAMVLADLLPDHVGYGVLSTPARAWSRGREASVWQTLDALTETLRALDSMHGRPVTLALEPQPDGVPATVGAAAEWLAGRVDPGYIGLCIDVRNLALAFAEPSREVSAVGRAGLSIWKLRATAPRHDEAAIRRAARELLRATVTALLDAAGPTRFPLVEVETNPGEPAADVAWVAALLDDTGLASGAAASDLGARSLAGPMTRVGDAWVGW